MAGIFFYDRLISRHGGAPGLRDRARFDQACAQPLRRAEDGETDLDKLATNYVFGIAKAHAFFDGNKRTAFVKAAAFLRLNGYRLRSDPVEGERMMNDLASGELSEKAFARMLNTGAGGYVDNLRHYKKVSAATRSLRLMLQKVFRSCFVLSI